MLLWLLISCSLSSMQSSQRRNVTSMTSRGLKVNLTSLPSSRLVILCHNALNFHSLKLVTVAYVVNAKKYAPLQRSTTVLLEEYRSVQCVVRQNYKSSKTN